MPHKSQFFNPVSLSRQTVVRPEAYNTIDNDDNLLLSFTLDSQQAYNTSLILKSNQVWKIKISVKRIIINKAKTKKKDMLQRLLSSSSISGAFTL